MLVEVSTASVESGAAASKIGVGTALGPATPSPQPSHLPLYLHLHLWWRLAAGQQLPPAQRMPALAPVHTCNVRAHACTSTSLDSSQSVTGRTLQQADTRGTPLPSAHPLQRRRPLR